MAVGKKRMSTTEITEITENTEETAIPFVLSVV